MRDGVVDRLAPGTFDGPCTHTCGELYIQSSHGSQAAGWKARPEPEHPEETRFRALLRKQLCCDRILGHGSCHLPDSGSPTRVWRLRVQCALSARARAALKLTSQALLPAWRATCLVFHGRGITRNHWSATDRIDASLCGAHGDSSFMHVRAAASDVGVGSRLGRTQS